ncbi:hypothetical protein D3C85_1308100 [compost metagenome]
MQVDMAERYLVGSIEAEHDHARNPWIEDIYPCFENTCGIEPSQLAAIEEVGGGKRPLAATEPSIECIFFATICCTININIFIINLVVKDPIIRVVDILESWDWNSPWYLAADIPVAKIVIVLNQCLLLACWTKRNLTRFNCLFGAIRKGAYINKPLIFDEWLNWFATLVIVADRMLDYFLATS